MSTMSIKPLAEDFFEKYVLLIVPRLDDVEKVLNPSEDVGEYGFQSIVNS